MNLAGMKNPGASSKQASLLAGMDPAFQSGLIGADAKHRADEGRGGGMESETQQRCV
jgi:hypothetical protein